MQVSKEKTFSICFSKFFKSTLNFEHFEKSMNLMAYALTKIQTPNVLVKQTSKKSQFRRQYEKQHGKQSWTLLKSA